MKIMVNTPNISLIEVKYEDLEIKGFDSIWDSIRESYPQDKYFLEHIKDDNENDCLFFSLKKN